MKTLITIALTIYLTTTAFSQERKLDISNLDKAEILAGLYNNANPLALGWLEFDPRLMTVDEARQIIRERGLRFDYFKGHAIRIDLSRDEFDFTFYDFDNGEGVAEYVVRTVRNREIR